MLPMVDVLNCKPYKALPTELIPTNAVSERWLWTFYGLYHQM